MATNTPPQILPTTGSATDEAAYKDILEIKPPVEIPTGWEFLLWLLGAVVLGFLVAWLWSRFRKLRETQLAPPPPPAPHVVAWNRLQRALDIIHYPERFCTEVAQAVREYLEARFSLHAPERTTEEFLDELRFSTVLNGDHQELIAPFLERCDLVKFARDEPTETELKQLQEAACRFVAETEQGGKEEVEVEAVPAVKS